MVFTIALAAAACLSFVLTLWQWFVAARFPLHQRRPTPLPSSPPVTLLKPLKGCDAETERCLRSWFEQDYRGPVQLLFGVASADDPVCSVVRGLLARYPQADAQLVICRGQLGPNAKVSTLAQLEPFIAHEILVISDADVCAPADLLVNLVPPLADPEVGLVNCLYQFANPVTPAMQLEAVAVNADFWSQVLQAQSLKPLDFALGAVMATTRSQLATFGGFPTLVEHLADDYQLGHEIATRGARVTLCPIVVECRSEPVNWQQVWTHQLRWLRTIRVCQPAPFFFSLLSNGTFWPLLWLVLRPGLFSAVTAICFWAVRIVSAVSNQRRLTRSPILWTNLLLVPTKDLLTVLLWALAFLGREIEWRGQRYRVEPSGKLLPVSSQRL